MVVLIIDPHGGNLVDRTLDAEKREQIRKDSGRLPKIEIDNETLQDVENIARGVYSPLEGFMLQEDFDAVLHHKRLANDLPWTIPVTLDVEDEVASNFEEGDEIALVNRNQVRAILHLEEKYNYEKREFSEQVFRTNDTSHPGVERVHKMGGTLLGGKIDLVLGSENPFKRVTYTPAETRTVFKEHGWETIAGFQTRNPPHKGHEYLQRMTLSLVDGLFINPLIGRKKPGDFRNEVIVSLYELLVNDFFPEDRVFLGILRTWMRYAGPREAIFHAIIRKNFGCTHFIVGRDHAGVSDFYPPDACFKIFDEFDDLGVEPIIFEGDFFYCKRCRTVASDRTCPHDESQHIDFSGSRIRANLQTGKVVPEEVMRRELVDAALQFRETFVT